MSSVMAYKWKLSYFSLVCVCVSAMQSTVSDNIGLNIMVYGSTPYVGMTLKKDGGHNKSAQMTRSKCLC